MEEYFKADLAPMGERIQSHIKSELQKYRDRSTSYQETVEGLLKKIENLPEALEPIKIDTEELKLFEGRISEFRLIC